MYKNLNKKLYLRKTSNNVSRHITIMQYYSGYHKMSADIYIVVQ